MVVLLLRASYSDPDVHFQYDGFQKRENVFVAFGFIFGGVVCTLISDEMSHCQLRHEINQQMKIEKKLHIVNRELNEDLDDRQEKIKKVEDDGEQQSEEQMKLQLQQQIETFRQQFIKECQKASSTKTTEMTRV